MHVDSWGAGGWVSCVLGSSQAASVELDDEEEDDNDDDDDDNLEDYDNDVFVLMMMTTHFMMITLMMEGGMLSVFCREFCGEIPPFSVKVRLFLPVLLGGWQGLSSCYYGGRVSSSKSHRLTP